MDRPVEWQGDARPVHIAVGPVTLEGNLSVPERAGGVVLFAHGSGSSRHSPRNRNVAQLLNEAKLATLLIDLLTSDEEAIDLRTAHLRFDIGFLAERLLGATDWLTLHPDTRDLRGRLLRRQHWRRRGAAGGSGTSSRGPCRRLAGGTSGSGRAGPGIRPSAHSAHRGGERRPGHRAEPDGARAAQLRKAARDRSRGDAPLRRAWCNG